MYVEVGDYLSGVGSVVYADVAVRCVHGSLDGWYEFDEGFHECFRDLWGEFFDVLYVFSGDQ